MRPKTEFRVIQIGEQALSYEWKRGGVKNINLRVRVDGTVYVSSPHSVSLRTMEGFLREKAEMIFRAREEMLRKKAECPELSFREGEELFLFGERKRLHFSAGMTEKIIEKDGFLLLPMWEQEEKTKKMLQTYAEAALWELILQLTRAFLPMFSGVEFPHIRLRPMKATWGNCRAKSGILTFNSRLACYPVPCIEYVVMHELSHFLVPNHSADFYAVLSARMPDWKERKTLLNTLAVTPFF